jgi:hypothetical protein
MATEEEDVLDSLLMYRYDAVKDILKAFDWSYPRVLQKLKSYGNKGAYHGHGTQRPGFGVAGAARNNQDLAIIFLNANLPSGPSPTATKKAPNYQKKSENKTYNAIGLRMIQLDDHLGRVQMNLSAWDADWQDNRVVKEAYAAKKLEKDRAREAEKEARKKK